MINNERYNKNLAIIEKNDPRFFEEYIKYDFSTYQIQNVGVDIAQDGSRLIKYKTNEYEWYLNSRYEPLKVAKRWVDTVGKMESLSTVMLFGIGNGLYLNELLKIANEKVVFIVYEPSIDIFLTTLSEINLSFIDERVFFLVEGINDAKLELYFESFVTFENLSICKFLWHPNYWSCFKEEGIDYHNRVQYGIKYIYINKNTKIKFGEAYYKNILMNLRYLPQGALIDRLFDTVGKEIPEDYPVIIVSAGPSLSKNVKQLEKAKGKAFILATDSAMIGLLDAGITPDAFATIDALKTLNRFDDERIFTVPVICPESARYEVLERHKDKKIFANNDFGYGSKFYEKLKIQYNPFGYGGSVATFAFTVARLMGFKRIILVGQDLAFTDDNRYYSKVKRWSESAEEKLIEVEGIDGGKVKTSEDLALYLEWFEKQLKECKEIETIDATEGGAKIHGTNIMTLDSAIEKYCCISFDMEEFLRGLPLDLDEENRQEMIALIKGIPEQFNILYEDAKAGIDYYERLISMLKSNRNNSAELMELTKKITMLTEKIENSQVYSHIEHKTREVEYEVLKNLGISLEDEIEDAIQVANRGKAMLKAIIHVLDNGVLEEVKDTISKIQ